MTTRQIAIVASAAVIAVVVASLTALIVWGPQDIATQITAGLSALAGSGLLLRAFSRLAADDDGDGRSNAEEWLAALLSGDEEEE